MNRQRNPHKNSPKVFRSLPWLHSNLLRIRAGSAFLLMEEKLPVYLAVLQPIAPGQGFLLCFSSWTGRWLPSSPRCTLEVLEELVLSLLMWKGKATLAESPNQVSIINTLLSVCPSASESKG